MSGPEMIVALAALGIAGYTVNHIISLFKRKEPKSPPVLSPATEERMARIEQAVDAIAVEVERISEGQRFTTRLLADRVQNQPLQPPKPPVQS